VQKNLDIVGQYNILNTMNMNLSISNQERIDLKRLLDTNDCENNTEHIRKVKHSLKIQKDVMDLVTLKKSRGKISETDQTRPATMSPTELVVKEAFSPSCQEQLELEAREITPFLYENYADIFKKILRDEIDFQILAKLLYVLQAIEEEKVDQHEGSVLVGRVLKEMYLDSAVKHGENLDKKYQDEQPVKIPEKLISWKQYKEQTVNTV